MLIEPLFAQRFLGSPGVKFSKNNKKKVFKIYMANFFDAQKHDFGERSSLFRCCFSELDLDNVYSWEM